MEHQEKIMPHDAHTLKFVLAGNAYVTLEPVLPVPGEPKSCTYRIKQKCMERSASGVGEFQALATEHGVSNLTVMENSSKTKEAEKALRRALSGEPGSTMEDAFSLLPEKHHLRIKVHLPHWYVDFVPATIGECSPRELGAIDHERVFRTTAKTDKSVATAHNINLFGDTLRDLVAGIPKGHITNIWHTGRCGKCGKALKLPVSIATGFGPECADVLGITMVKPEPNIVDKIAALEGQLDEEADQ